MGGGAGLDDLLDAAGAVAPGADGLVVVPFLAPERSPLWEPERAGALLGLCHHHGPAHVARAAVEGVGLQIAALVRRVEAVVEVGGVGEVRAAQLNRLDIHTVLAAGLDRPVLVGGDVTGTALGAAALGWCAVGGAADLETARADLVGAGEAIEVVAPDAVAVAAAAGTGRRLTALAEDLPRVAAGLDPEG